MRCLLQVVEHLAHQRFPASEWPHPDEDDYDPRKPEYVLPATELDVRVAEAALLQQQIESLRTATSRRHVEEVAWYNYEEDLVVQHYRQVLAEFEIQAADQVVGLERLKGDDGCSEIEAPKVAAASAAAAETTTAIAPPAMQPSQPSDEACALPVPSASSAVVSQRTDAVSALRSRRTSHHAAMDAKFKVGAVPSVFASFSQVFGGGCLPADLCLRSLLLDLASKVMAQNSEEHLSQPVGTVCDARGHPLFLGSYQVC